MKAKGKRPAAHPHVTSQKKRRLHEDVGLPDAVRLAVPKAYVVLVAGAEPSRELAGDILAFCRDNLAPYKRIRRLEFADLPKTISGKIRRVELRQAEAGHAGQRPSGEYREEDFG